MEINLLPWREEKRELIKKQFIRKIGVLFAIIFSSFIILFCVIKKKISTQVYINENLVKKINFYNKLLINAKKMKEVRQKMLLHNQRIKNLLLTRPLTIHLLDELINILPPAIHLTKLIRKKQSILIIGFSKTNAAISLLMKNIESNTWLKNPFLIKVKKRMNNNTIPYIFYLRFMTKL